MVNGRTIAEDMDREHEQAGGDMMNDIVADAKAWLADIGGQRLQTHSDNCHLWHSACLVGKLTREIERLRLAIRRLADQDATLSVCDGAVTVTMDATPDTHAAPTEGSVQGRCTLTVEEREAIHHVVGDVADITGPVEATLRSLLERLQ